MSSGAILRAKKLKGAGIVRAAAAHNKRAIHAEASTGGAIDGRRSHLNECLGGAASVDAVAEAARNLLDAAGVGKLRKDAVRAVEFVVSLAPLHTINDRAFFAAALEWLTGRFGGACNLLSADIHRDEAAPHMHVLLLPLIEGRMRGSEMLGGRSQLAALHGEFHAVVAAPYGLRRAPAKLQGSAKASGVESVLLALNGSSDAALRSSVWGVIRECIERDPSAFMVAMGIAARDPEPRKLRSMTAIFTSKGKGGSASDAHEPYRLRAVGSV